MPPPYAQVGGTERIEYGVHTGSGAAAQRRGRCTCLLSVTACGHRVSHSDYRRRFGFPIQSDPLRHGGAAMGDVLTPGPRIDGRRQRRVDANSGLVKLDTLCRENPAMGASASSRIDSARPVVIVFPFFW